MRETVVVWAPSPSVLQSVRLAEQLFVVRRTTTPRANMRRGADEQFVRREIPFELFFHFAQSLGHGLNCPSS